MSRHGAEQDRHVGAGRYPPIRLSRPRVLVPLVIIGAVVVLLRVGASMSGVREAPLAAAGATSVLIVLAVGHVAWTDLALGESRLSPTAQRLLAVPLIVGAAAVAIWGTGATGVAFVPVALAVVLPTSLPAALPRRVRAPVLRVLAWEPGTSRETTGTTRPRR